MDHFKAHVWFSPAAVVADSDAVQASDGEGTEGQSDEDDVKHSELCRKHENNYFTQKKHTETSLTRSNLTLKVLRLKC